ncbi:MAG TPA: hypothetical protein VN426_09235 [Syntrophomonadaceae bacterium]|nr:hypothetical protein [Syntrophomonadaceae bacterium]
MPQFKVADLILDINCAEEEIIGSFSRYKLISEEKYDLKISINQRDYIEPPQGKHIIDEKMKWLHKPGGESGYYFYSQETSPNRVIVLLDVDAGCEQGLLYYLNSEPEVRYSPVLFYIHNLPGIMFRYNLLRHEGIVVHASAIAWKGRGFIFSAPSGTGKSTHAKLWQEYFGAEVMVINEDTPALRFRNNQPFVFGTPWSGNGVNNNISAPLEAIVILEQAPHNMIRKLSLQEAMHHLMPRCFLPYFDERFMHLAMAVFERIVLSVPVYLLQCLPDQEAVEMVYQCVK